MLNAPKNRVTLARWGTSTTTLITNCKIFWYLF